MRKGLKIHKNKKELENAKKLKDSLNQFFDPKLKNWGCYNSYLRIWNNVSRLYSITIFLGKIVGEAPTVLLN